MGKSKMDFSQVYQSYWSRLHFVLSLGGLRPLQLPHIAFHTLITATLNCFSSRVSKGIIFGMHAHFLISVLEGYICHIQLYYSNLQLKLQREKPHVSLAQLAEERQVEQWTEIQTEDGEQDLALKPEQKLTLGGEQILDQLNW